MIAIAVAALVNLVLAGGVELVWRRRREALHARSWTAAFLLTALGWTIVAWIGLLGPAIDPPQAAATLCWLGAALLFVHGLRLRAGRPPRAAVLAAIWAGTAFGVALLRDLLWLDRTVVASAVPMLAALGLLLAAFAVMPRVQSAWTDMIATGLLVALALAQLAIAWTRFVAPVAAHVLMALAPTLALPAYVALGVAVMLLLNEDLRTALDRLARTDPLTGVWNRRGFEEGAATLVERLRRSHNRVAAVAIADIDSFKAINDQHGHGVGDAALVRFARQLRTAAQAGDILARLGGEEFALLAIGVDGAGLMERMERARSLIALPDGEGANGVSLTASFGVAQLSQRTLSIRDALERADHALYRAKMTGKNRTVLADSVGAAAG